MKPIHFLFASCLAIAFATPVHATFSDLEQAHPNYDAIAYMQSQGIVEGYPDGTFRPNQTINRAEFTKIITIADNGGLPNQGARACFKDIRGDEWYAAVVCWALGYNAISGYPDGTFRPANTINFAEAAKIIVKIFDPNGMSPVPANEPWFRPFVQYLGEHGAIPISINSFDQKITRGEMAEIVYRLKTKNEDRPSLSYATLERNDGQIENTQQEQDTNLSFLLSKLKDPNYTDTYGDGYTLYIAAEELGQIGKPAIPFLIEKLSTTDDFERTQVLYALQLAAQNLNVRIFTGGEYVQGNGMAFPEPENHPVIVNSWKEWFEKYKSNF